MRKTESDDSIEVTDAGDSGAVEAIPEPEPTVTPPAVLDAPQAEIEYVSYPGFRVVKGSKADTGA